MAAAADINLGAALNAQGRNGQVRIYTTGEPAAALSRQDLQRLGLLTPPVLLDGSTTGSYAGPFFEHAGAIGLSAGRDLLGLPAYRYGGTGVQYVSDWWWRQVNDTAANKGLAFWVRYDQFAQGIASFGGGNIALRAGRDLVDVEASTPMTGYSVKAEGTPGQPDFREARSVWYAGGSLSASAGRDVRGGLFNAGGAEARLSAGAHRRGQRPESQPEGAPTFLSGHRLDGNGSWRPDAGLAGQSGPAGRGQAGQRRAAFRRRPGPGRSCPGPAAEPGR